MARFEIAPEFKKLYARILRLSIGKYLLTDRFEHLLIEHGADGIWNACLQNVRRSSGVVVFSPGYTRDHEDALGLFIEAGLVNDLSTSAFAMRSTIVAVLADFLDWATSKSRTSIDLPPVFEALLELGCSEEFLQPLRGSGYMPATAPQRTTRSSQQGDGSPMKKSPSKPRLFIGSSVEGLPVAEALHANLDYDFEVTTWTHGVFGLSSSTIEDLERAVKLADFAVLIMTPDDQTTVRDESKPTARDNVIFELGLFMGALGRQRTFVVQPRKSGMKIPTDLAGISFADYDSARTDNNLKAALSAACLRIKEAAARIGLKGGD